MKPAELFASRVFLAIEPENPLRYIDDQSTSVQGFWIAAADGNVGALEVTSFHDVEMTRAHRAIQSERHGGAVAESRLVTKGWLVHPSASADIRAVRSRVDSYLARIESEGRDHFVSDVDLPNSPAVAAIYSDLRVESGRVVKWKTARQIRMALSGKGTLVSSANVLAMIRTVSHLSDNRSKLNASACLRRVLFIEVDENAADQWAPFASELPPSDAPELPSEITEVWVASSIGADSIIWRWRDGVWSHHVVDLEQLDTSRGAG